MRNPYYLYVIALLKEKQFGECMYIVHIYVETDHDVLWVYLRMSRFIMWSYKRYSAIYSSHVGFFHASNSWNASSGGFQLFPLLVILHISFSFYLHLITICGVYSAFDNSLKVEIISSNSSLSFLLKILHHCLYNLSSQINVYILVYWIHLRTVITFIPSYFLTT